MFHSAAVRLTIWYTAIIMALSISTSFALYQVSNDYLEQNTDRQAGYFGGLLGPQSADEFASLRQKLLDENRDQLKGKLVIFNVLVLIGGGVASYGLARRTLRPIEETLESQVRFTADASHELRTPLTAIQTENEVALRNSKLSKDEAVAILKSNLEEAAKLKALSEGLLSLAHSNGDDELAEKVSAKDIVASAKERVSKAAKLKEISISPVQKTADVTLKGNQQKLVDLLVILLDNAVKYSPAGSKIKIGIKKHGKYGEISIADEGQGIKKTDLPNIFERFYRADHSRSKQRADGYGLGLAIAKKIADSHHGVIVVSSAVGKGSVFTVRLPKP